MWKFRGGYLGACIIALSILLGVAGGLLLNVDQEPYTTTKYDYVTDITGLFQTTQEPQYIEYNPASNYTGYTNTDVNIGYQPTGINFTETTTANNYQIMTQRGTTSAGPSGTLDNSSSYPQASFSGKEPVYNSSSNHVFRNFKVTTVYAWATSVFGTLTDYENIEVDFDYSNTRINNSPYIDWNAGIGVKKEGSGMPPLVDPNNTVALEYWYQGIQKVDKIIINPDNLTFDRYYNNQFIETRSLYDSYIVYGNATYYYANNGTTTTYNGTLEINYTSSLTTSSHYSYMVPNQGVTLDNYDDNGDTVYYGTVWDNDASTIDYGNQKIDLLIGPPLIYGVPTYSAGDYGITIKAPGPTVNDWIEFKVLRVSSGSFYISIDQVISNVPVQLVDSTYIGDFNEIVLSIDKTDKSISIYGVSGFNNYWDADILPLASFSVNYTLNTDLDNLTFTIFNTTTPLTWSVYNTLVFMDTYNSVLVNPSINLANYWGNMDSYRYAFQSFAIYGDSVTINGVTYPIVDEHITIGTKSYKFDNIYLSFSKQGQTSITFKNINKTVELGDTVDKIVSFSGVWYFSTGLYEGHETTENRYIWDIGNLAENIDIDMMILTSLGLILVLCLVCAVMKVQLKTMDKLVLLLGAVVLFIILGGA